VQERNLILEPDNNIYSLGDSPIIKNSVSVWADSLLLNEGTDYRVDHNKAKLILICKPEVSILNVEYIIVPPFLTQPWQRWQPQIYSDTLLTEIKKRKSPAFIEETNLEIRGTKTFAISFSDESTFDLKQSLFVNLSGELAHNVFISAQLSDSQSKLSPEGDSKELSSLDNMDWLSESWALMNTL